LQLQVQVQAEDNSPASREMTKVFPKLSALPSLAQWYSSEYFPFSKRVKPSTKLKTETQQNQGSITPDCVGASFTEK
jgi:hypothetical protein